MNIGKLQRFVALFLLCVMTLNFVSCTFAEDVLYDVGIHVNFDDIEKEAEELLDSAQNNLSERIQNMVDDSWASLKNIFKSDEIGYNDIPGNADLEVSRKHEYIVEFSVEKVTLPASKREVFLFPLNGYTAIKAYDKSSGTEVSLETAGFHFEFSENNFTLDEYGTLCAIRPGMSSFCFTQVKDGKTSEQYYSIFVAECDFSEKDIYSVFSEKEKEYITTCLDLSYTLYKAQETSSMLEWNWRKNILLNVKNLSDNMTSFFLGKDLKEARVEAVFSKFFKSYVEKYIAEDTETYDWEIIKTAIKCLDTLKGVTQLKPSIKDAITEVKDWVNKINTHNANVEEQHKVLEILHMVYSDDEVKKAIESTKEGRETLSDLKITVTNLQTSIDNFYKAAGQLTITGMDDTVNEFIDRAFKKDGVLDKSKVIGEGMKLGITVFDTISYIMYDYCINVKYLLTIKEGLEEYKKTLSAADDSVDLEIECIEHLIEDYNNKYVSSAETFAAKLATQGVELFANMSAVYSVTSFVLGIIADQSHVSDTEQVTVLSLYASATFHTLDPIHELFMYGRMSTDYNELRYRVSLYLNLMLDINKTMKKHASGDDKKVLQENQDYIEKTLKPYLSIDES